jgi:hypothetical protein
MVVFGHVVGDMVMLLTGVNGGVMVVYVFLFGHMVMPVTGGVIVVMVMICDRQFSMEVTV